jgi:hypothetical protein
MPEATSTGSIRLKLDPKVLDAIRVKADPNLTQHVGGAEPPSDPTVRALAEDFADGLKYAFAAAAADVKVVQPGAIDGLMRTYLASRSEPVRTAYRTRAQAMLGSAAGRAKAFGRLAAVEPQQYAKAGSDRLSTIVARPVVTAKHLEAAVAARRIVLHINLDEIKRQADLAAGAKYTKLGLFLKEVHCTESTDDESGSDEILLGGSACDPGGTTRRLSTFKVSDDFDSDESVLYPAISLAGVNLADFDALMKRAKDAAAQPGRLLAEWKLRTDLKWPAVYSAILVMGEEDWGGFGDFLGQVWTKVEADWKKFIEKALTSLGEEYLGEIGKLIGEAVAWVLNTFLGWLIGGTRDDLIAVRTLTMSLGAATRSYYDWAKLTTLPHPGTFDVPFRGDGGRYHAYLYFKVYA